MTHKEEILKAIEDEIKIIKHLYTKIPEDKLDFKPVKNTRTINELLRYLTWSGFGTLKTFIDGDDDSPNYKIYKELSESAKTLKPENFPAVMDQQLDSIKKLFDKFNDDDLLTKNVMQPFGEKQPLGEAIIKTSV